MSRADTPAVEVAGPLTVVGAVEAQAEALVDQQPALMGERAETGQAVGSHHG